MARNKHPEETVEKILDVSMRLFSEKGYEATTIQDITHALGMSKGAVYHHFKSKEDILDRLSDRYYQRLEHKKPLIGFVAGNAVPFGHKMGYAGDIMTNGHVSAQDKKDAMAAAGITVVEKINDIHKELSKIFASA